MAIIPVNVARVSQNLRVFNILQTSRNNQVGLFQVQNQLATGLRFLTASEDPVAATRVNLFDRKLEQIAQIEKNLDAANSTFTTVETTMIEAIDLLTDAHNITLEAVSDTTSADGRASLAGAVERIIDQLISVGNRQHLDAFLFAGHDTRRPPFEFRGTGGIGFYGDMNTAETIIDSNFAVDSFTVSGIDFFNAVSGAVNGTVDLDPVLTSETRVVDLRGTTGTGVQLGSLLVTDGAGQRVIDLTPADTVGDMVDILNENLPTGVSAVLGPVGLQIVGVGSGGPVTVTESAGSNTARDLGLLTGMTVGTSVAPPFDLDPVVTPRTEIADLQANVLARLSDGLTLRSGLQNVTLDFSNAETVEDMLNVFNASDLGVLAQIAPDGRSIEVRSRVSGVNFAIEEAGGTLATALGVRSMNGGTTLADLNDRRGVTTVPGDDIRIVTADGTTVDIDVDGAETLADVIARFNAAGSGAITAGFAANGNGLMITDNTTGTGTLLAERLNVSPALDGLGLDVTSTGGQLVGRDVNPVIVDSPFTALLELREGLRGDDTQTLQIAGERIERMMTEMQAVQGRTAAQARQMEDRAIRMQDEVLSTRILLSDVRDADLSETILRFQQMETALQANYATASRVLNLSLIDFLQ